MYRYSGVINLWVSSAKIVTGERSQGSRALSGKKKKKKGKKKEKNRAAIYEYCLYFSLGCWMLIRQIERDQALKDVTCMLSRLAGRRVYLD